MLRANLLRLGADDHVLQLVLHHIATDAWSMGILMQELIVGYQARTSGSTPVLPVLPIQFADYAYWQRSEAQQRLLARAIDYWRRRLDGAPTLIPLPLDQPRPARPDYQGAALEQRFTAAQTQVLKAYAQAQRATLFMVLLNAFNSLLQRATGANDFIVGTDLANREHPALEHLIGFFVNVLPIRARLSEGETFDVRLQRLREDCLSAFQHQQVPFDKLVEELQPPRTPGVNPLVQVLFVMQNTPSGNASLPDLEVEHLVSPSGKQQVRPRCVRRRGRGTRPERALGVSHQRVAGADRPAPRTRLRAPAEAARRGPGAGAGPVVVAP